MTQDFHRPFPEGVIAPASEQKKLLETMAQDRVQFLRLIFTDIMGQNKNVEVPTSQFGKGLRGEIMFDGANVADAARRNCRIRTPEPLEL